MNSSTDGKITILMLAANPTNTGRLRLDQEFRDIEEGLKRSKLRDQFNIVSRWAVRPGDFQLALEEEKPQVVHFSGHGAGERGIVLDDDSGKAHFVPIEALAQLFEFYQDTVECVVLNACFTDVQAKAIGRHIDYVTGTNRSIKDQSAIDFAVGFYNSLGAGRLYKDAFKLGCLAVGMGGDVPGSKIPVLVEKSELDIELSTTKSRKIFISYKRDAEIDEAVAKQVCDALQASNHNVFIDKMMPVGDEWAKRIKSELKQSDFLITFLSVNSVDSEMVKGEIETAYQFAAEQGKPKILPVRLAYREPFTDALGNYLNSINWALWDSPEDTPRLIEELLLAIQGDVLPIDTKRCKEDLVNFHSETLVISSGSIDLSQENPSEIVPLTSGLYVEREIDKKALDLIRQEGQAIVLVGPENAGKSSLLLRIKDAAVKSGKQIVHLDFNQLGKPTLESDNLFFRRFCRLLTDNLDLENWVTKSWEEKDLGNLDNCTRCMKRHILPQLKSPLVLAIEGTKCLFKYEYCSEFLGMLRAWHVDPDEEWKALDFVVTVPPETLEHIENPIRYSPFYNSGTRLELKDFTSEQVADLVQRHGLLLSPQQQQQLMELLGGHPFLIRKALYEIATHISFDNLLEKATSDDSPFRDHLRYQIFRLATREDLRLAFLQTIQRQTCDDLRILLDLQAFGLVIKEGRSVKPRCQLYAKYFQEQFND